MKILKVLALLVFVSSWSFAGKPGVAIDTITLGGGKALNFSACANFTTDSLSVDTIDLGAMRASWYQIACASCASTDTVKWSDAQTGRPAYAMWLTVNARSYVNPSLAYGTSTPLRYLYILANGRKAINVIFKN